MVGRNQLHDLVDQINYRTPAAGNKHYELEDSEYGYKLILVDSKTGTASDVSQNYKAAGIHAFLTGWATSHNHKLTNEREKYDNYHRTID